MTKPLCLTCRYHIIRQYLMRGVPTESPDCEKHVVSFPDVTSCRDYERCPGSDDE